MKEHIDYFYVVFLVYLRARLRAHAHHPLHRTHAVRSIRAIESVGTGGAWKSCYYRKAHKFLYVYQTFQFERHSKPICLSFGLHFQTLRNSRLRICMFDFFSNTFHDFIMKRQATRI